MAKKMSEYGKLNKEQADAVEKGFLHIADAYELMPGVKVPIDDMIQKAHEKLLSDPDEPERAKEILIKFLILSTPTMMGTFWWKNSRCI